MAKNKDEGYLDSRRRRLGPDRASMMESGTLLIFLEWFDDAERERVDVGRGHLPAHAAAGVLAAVASSMGALR